MLIIITSHDFYVYIIIAKTKYVGCTIHFQYDINHDQQGRREDKRILSSLYAIIKHFHAYMDSETKLNSISFFRM